MKKTIFSCGNSFSAGTYLQAMDGNRRIVSEHKPYGEILAEWLACDFVLLARPSASNYFVCKQVEYAIEQNADLILINFSSPRHLDFTLPSKRLETLPHLKNFDYVENIWWADKANPAGGNPEEHAVHSWYFSLFDIYGKTTNPELNVVNNFIATYNDYQLRMDQERLMILGLMEELKKSNNKYIISDFIGLAKEKTNSSDTNSLADINVLNHLNLEPLVCFSSNFISQYPNENDSFHFNQEGHRVAAEMILPIAKSLIGT